MSSPGSTVLQYFTRPKQYFALRTGRSPPHGMTPRVHTPSGKPDSEMISMGVCQWCTLDSTSHYEVLTASTGAPRRGYLGGGRGRGRDRACWPWFAPCLITPMGDLSYRPESRSDKSTRGLVYMGLPSHMFGFGHAKDPSHPLYPSPSLVSLWNIRQSSLLLV